MASDIFIPNYPFTTRQDHVSISIDNEYIPVSSLREGYVYKEGDNKMFIYGLVDIGLINTRTIKKVHLLCHRLSGRDSRPFWISSGDLFKNRYIISDGIVLWQRQEDYRVIPLLLLCVKKEHLFNINEENPDPNQFCLLVDRQFIADEEHFKLWRNVERLYVDSMQSKVDVLYTNSILNRCFRIKSIELPKSKNVVEMIQGFKQINELVTQCIKGEVKLELVI